MSNTNVIPKIGNYEVGTEVINFTYRFDTILSTLPLPLHSKEGFASLCTELKPFGISITDINADMGSNNLGELGMTVRLLDGIAVLRITYENFDINFEVKKPNSKAILSDLLYSTCKIIESMYGELKQGIVQIRWSGHLLSNGELNVVMSDYATIKGNTIAKLSPDIVIYNVDFDKTEAHKAKVLIGNSKLYPNEGIYIECQITYWVSGDPTGVLQQFDKDLYQVIAALNLDVKLEK